MAVHQISEILPVKGVMLVGPLPADMQNTTVLHCRPGRRRQRSLRPPRP